MKNTQNTRYRIPQTCVGASVQPVDVYCSIVQISARFVRQINRDADPHKGLVHNGSKVLA